MFTYFHPPLILGAFFSIQFFLRVWDLDVKTEFFDRILPRRCWLIMWPPRFLPKKNGLTVCFEAMRMWSSLPREEIGHVISGVKAAFFFVENLPKLPKVVT